VRSAEWTGGGGHGAKTKNQLAFGFRLVANSAPEPPSTRSHPSGGGPGATTPASASTKTVGGQTLELVFSDEFTEDGRQFGPGRDSKWEAVDLWYSGQGLAKDPPQQV